MNWTREQLDAIRTTGTNLLVSAAAGSGKTAVLAERCAYLVCDAPEKCEIDRLLVVTFTNAAADEMRARIEQALRKRQGAEDDPRLEKQIMLLGRAQIDTLHGFCTSFLRRHFHVLGLDPNFRIFDAEEVALLKHEIAREVLDSRYETDDPQFQQLIDDYADGYDRRILDHMLHLHDLMQSVVDPEAWLKDAAARIAEVRSAKKLAGCELGRELVELIQQWLADLRLQWIALAKSILPIPGLAVYGEYVNNLIAAVDHWRDVFGGGRFDELARELCAFKAPKLPTIPNPPPEKEAIQEQIGSIRREMREGSLSMVCRFTEQQWRDGLAATYAPAKVLIELVREFDKEFAQAKRDLRGVDFADLERFTLQILGEKQKDGSLGPSPIARLYHRQFKHVLVDEYQDINPVQDAILSLLCLENNLFCVGDVKQSIYRFRLAQPRRFLERYERWKNLPSSGGIPGKSRGSVSAAEHQEWGPGRVIDLSASFRSRGPLLNTINSVFQRIMTRSAMEIDYDDSHKLRAGLAYPPADGLPCFVGAPVELHLLAPPPRGTVDDEQSPGDSDLDRTEREAAFVAGRIQQMLSAGMQVAEKSAEGPLSLRPLRYRDIIVLLRSLRFKSQQFAQALRCAGVPAHTDASTGFFESTEVRDMLSLLRVLDNQQQDVPLAAVLRSPLAALGDADDSLVRIRLAFPQVPFHRAAVLYARQKSDKLADQLRQWLVKLRQWRQMSCQRPVAELIWHIYDETAYLAYCAGLENGPQRVANLIEFHERARQFGTFQRQGLGRFIEFLHNLAEHADLGQPSVASQADDVVRVMSIHRAKGLEFPVVFVPDLGKQHNFQDIRGPVLADREGGIGLMVADQARGIRYPSLAHVLVQERIRRQTLAEEMRVLYVAMTRAREHLVLVGTCDESKPQQWRAEWADHDGPLPPARLLAAKTMLDWLGPAAAMMQNAQAADCIQTTWHDTSEVDGWSRAAELRASLPEGRKALVQLRPLDPPPTMHPQARQVIDRLTRVYPFRHFTEMPASQSVGELTKHGRFASGGASPSKKPIVPFDRELALPRCVVEEFKASSTDVGTATHLVLEHLDFCRKCDRQDLELQVADLLRRKFLSPALADQVDLEGIVWLMNTPLGLLLRRNCSTVRREVPVYSPRTAPQAPASDDPLDRIMLRGRIDLLIADSSGLVIADYKTDDVTAQTVEARAEFYHPQVQAYREAIEKMIGRGVKQAVLVFIKPRLLREV